MVDNTQEVGGQVPAMPEEYSSPARYLELICHLATYSPLLVTVSGPDYDALHHLAVAVAATHGGGNVCHLDGPGLFTSEHGGQLLLVRIADALGLTQLPTDEVAARETILAAAEARVANHSEPLLVLIESSEILSPVALNEIAQLALMASHKIAFALFGVGGFERLIKESPANAPRYRIQLAPARPVARPARPPRPAAREAVTPVSVAVAEPVVAATVEVPPVVTTRVEPVVVPVIEPEEREIPMDLGQDPEDIGLAADIRESLNNKPEPVMTPDIPPVSLTERRPKKPARPPLLDIEAIKARVQSLMSGLRSHSESKRADKAARSDSRKAAASLAAVNEPAPRNAKSASRGSNNNSKGSGLPVSWMLGASGILAVILIAMLYSPDDKTISSTTSLPPVVLNSSGPALGEGSAPTINTVGAATAQGPQGLTKMEPSGSYTLSDTVGGSAPAGYANAAPASGNSGTVRTQAVVAAPAAAKPVEIEQPKIVLNPAQAGAVKTPAASAPAKAEAPAKVAAPAPAKPVAAAPAAAKPASGGNVNSRLGPIMNARAGSQVIQMAGSSERKGAEDYVNKWSSQVKAGLYWYETTRDGKPWFVVVSGALPDKKAALAAASQFPAEIRTQSPWVRDVSQIQQQINQASANKK